MKDFWPTVTARELVKEFGCSDRLYREALKPLLHASLFAPPEQCSAAASLGMLYYYIFAHQVIYIHGSHHNDTKYVQYLVITEVKFRASAV